MLLQLPMAPVPVLEMLEKRGDLLPVQISPGSAQVERREAVHVARASSQWIIDGNADSKALLPRDIGLLRSHLWNCAPLPPRVRLTMLMRQLAGYVNPHLPPTEASKVWAAIRNAPCARQMTADDSAWVLLFEAVGARNTVVMASQGEKLLQSPDELPPAMITYALMAAATGLLADGRTALAAELVDREIEKLPKGIKDEPLFVMLRGYATHEDPRASVALGN
jgi:hypothetical protein